VIDLKTIVIAGFSHQDSINIKNKEIEDHIPNISPIALADIKGISTKFNEMRIIDSTGKVEIHSGLDIRADVGTKVYAMASGVAIIAGWDDGWGNRDLINCQNGYEYSISHLSKTFVTKNEIVYKGELIGLVGSTGNSTGPHADVRIYFNGKPVDPKLFF
jgi:murein DD-endopeptidase MepM/ murein hydrolase activator NlpD